MKCNEYLLDIDRHFVGRVNFENGNAKLCDVVLSEDEIEFIEQMVEAGLTSDFLDGTLYELTKVW